MSTLVERENELFIGWAQKRGNSFIKDGVVCPAEYEKAKYKILFVLKESNDFRESDMDMRSWVSKCGAIGPTWNNIARWTQAILEGNEFQENIATEDRMCWLNKICFLNLKKVNGKSIANAAEIKRFAQEDSALILKQIMIYKPDIIVCCGIDLVADCLANYVFHYKDKWESNRLFYVQIKGKTEKTEVINYYHPLNRGTKKNNKQLFNDMRELSKHSLKTHNNEVRK